MKKCSVKKCRIVSNVTRAYSTTRKGGTNHPFATGDTLVCYNTSHIPSRFSSNSEADGSELENREEILHRHYMRTPRSNNQIIVKKS